MHASSKLRKCAKKKKLKKIKKNLNNVLYIEIKILLDLAYYLLTILYMDSIVKC